MPCGQVQAPIKPRKKYKELSSLNTKEIVYRITYFEYQGDYALSTHFEITHFEYQEIIYRIKHFEYQTVMYRIKHFEYQGDYIYN